MALPKAQTPKEKRAVQFAVELSTTYGYGYTIRIPLSELTKELKSKGVKICLLTLVRYWKTLTALGYARKEMKCRTWGATYHLNRYAIQKFLENDR